jgi:aspartate dehydrogenase
MPFPSARLPRIGLIGGGAIASTIIADIKRAGYAEIDYVLVSQLQRKRDFELPNNVLIDDVQEALARDVDLVVEVALPELFAGLAPLVLQRSSFCGFSCTALANEDTQKAIEAATAAYGFRCHIPHGAVLALDGLADGRDAIDSVTITTTKSGKSFGVDPATDDVIFDGPAREACKRFPRNVNVHAALAVAGIGFDRTQSRIVAVPDKATMEHRIEVRGKGLEWDICVASQSLGGVTGAYTPTSAAGSVRRIFAGRNIQIA